MWCRKNVCCVTCIIKWLCACIIHYTVMFTCTLLRSHPESKKTLGETWATAIKAINSILWTSVASRCLLTGMGGRAELSMWPEGAHEGRICEVPQESWCSSMYINCVYIVLQCKSKPCYIRTFFTIINHRPLHVRVFCDCIITGVYFSQIKNKPWIPWVYMYLILALSRTGSFPVFYSLNTFLKKVMLSLFILLNLKANRRGRSYITYA